METIILAFALWFFYESLKALLLASGLPATTQQLLLFFYCLVAGLTLLYAGGVVARPQL
jgi:hypothetical protein